MRVDDAGLLVKELSHVSGELEWVEFKTNNKDPKTIGKTVSALANAATLGGMPCAYMVWGVDDTTHEIVGTDFDYRVMRCGNEELENWLHHQLSENASFEFAKGEVDGKHVVVLSVKPAFSHTVDFEGVAYIRVGSYTKPLKSYSTIEAEVWSRISRAEFELAPAMQDLSLLEALELLDYSKYFELLQTPTPHRQTEIAHYLIEDSLVKRQDDGRYSITNLGALLISKRISLFPGLQRKALRIVQYEGRGRREILKERMSIDGYARDFERAIEYLMALLPSRELIDTALRKKKTTYPEIALRESLSNMLVHQDLSTTGNGPVVEVFNDRIEFTNPGSSLIDPLRLVDNPPRSRNQRLAALMRRFGMCEELGTGWDKIIASCERAALPSPKVANYTENAGSMKVSLYAYVPFARMSPEDRAMAAYWHACICYMEGTPMSNASLRARFGDDSPSASTISRVIRDAVDDELIKPYDLNAGRKYMSYIPIWA